MVSELFTAAEFASLCRWVGFFGVTLYVGGFFCLSLGRLDSRHPAYFALVFVAASCVLVSLWAEFNFNAALIQLFYIVMSLCGMIARLRLVSPAPPRPLHLGPANDEPQSAQEPTWSSWPSKLPYAPERRI